MRSTNITFRFVNRVCCLAACLMVVGAECRASISVNVDATANTFYFSGSDSGTLGDYKGAYGYVEWRVGDSALGGIDVPLESDTLWTGAGTVFSTLFSFRPAMTYLNMAVLPAPSSGTISFSSDVFSYGGNATAESFFESLIGSSLPLTFGSGFQPVDIVAVSTAAVPEPSMFVVWALIGLASLGFVTLRKKYCIA
jgi:hypothetical protein